MSLTLTEEKREVPRVETAWTPPTTGSIPGGAAVAAIISAMLGMLTLALVNWGSEASNGFQAWVHGVGKLWMPGAAGIGPYSGKETLALVVWIASWLILHPVLRNRHVNVARWLVIFLVGVGVATTLLWPPVYGYLGGH